MLKFECFLVYPQIEKEEGEAAADERVQEEREQAEAEHRRNHKRWERGRGATGDHAKPEDKEAEGQEAEKIKSERLPLEAAGEVPRATHPVGAPRQWLEHGGLHRDGKPARDDDPRNYDEDARQADQDAGGEAGAETAAHLRQGKIERVPHRRLVAEIRLRHHADGRAGHDQVSHEAQDLRRDVETEVLLRPTPELDEQSQRRREALAHDRDTEEDAGVTPQQRERRIQNLAQRHRPELRGSHGSSFVIKMTPGCPPGEPRRSRSSRGASRSRRRSTWCSSSSSPVWDPVSPLPRATPCCSPSCTWRSASASLRCRRGPAPPALGRRWRRCWSYSRPSWSSGAISSCSKRSTTAGRPASSSWAFAS